MPWTTTLYLISIVSLDFFLSRRDGWEIVCGVGLGISELDRDCWAVFC